MRQSVAWLIVPLLILALAVKIWSLPNEARQPPTETPSSTEARAFDAEIRLPPPSISRQTTYLNGPVDADGYIDYFVALNQHESAGVTVDNNAQVLFARANIGPSDFEEPQRQQFLERLGIQTPDEIQVSYQLLLSNSGITEADLDQAAAAPWTVDQFPEIARQLALNEAALDLVIEGTKRPYCFIPMIPPTAAGGEKGKLLDARLAVLQTSRDVLRALGVRAMLQLAQSDLVRAQADLIACHRLARLLGGSSHLISGLVGCAIDSTANRGDVELLRHGKLSVAAVREYLDQLQQLAPLPPMVEKLDFGERLMLLDALTAMERNTAAQVVRREVASDEATIIRLRSMHDEMLRVCNERFDEFVAAGRLPTFAERQAELERLVAKLRASLPANHGDGDSRTMADFQAQLRHELSGQSEQLIGRAMGERIISLMFPDFVQAMEVETRTSARRYMTWVAFALVAYQGDHGAYPDTLAALVPRYVSELPNDPFTERALHYRRSQNGFEIWSAGKEGMSRRDQPDKANDDILLQFP